jgi:hypothetical protein
MSRHRNRRKRRGGESPSQKQAPMPSASRPPAPAPNFVRRPWLFLATAIVVALWLAYLLILYFTTVRPMEHRVVP